VASYGDGPVGFVALNAEDALATETGHIDNMDDGASHCLGGGFSDLNRIGTGHFAVDISSNGMKDGD